MNKYFSSFQKSRGGGDDPPIKIRGGHVPPPPPSPLGSPPMAECDQLRVSILSVRDTDEQVMKGLHHHENYPRL